MLECWPASISARHHLSTVRYHLSELDQQQQAAELRLKLRDLAWEVTGYLRRHTSAAVRVAAAVLLAASLAACGTYDARGDRAAPVAPLTQEVSTGLPRAPGFFPVAPGSVFRDQRGVYQLEWQEPLQPEHRQGAQVSRLRIAQGDRLALEIPAEGADPILHLPKDERIGMVEAVTAQPTRGPGYYPPVYWWWRPYAGGVFGGPDPVYRDPPPERPFRPGGEVAGSRSSTTLPPPQQRVAGLGTAVSGRAGGTGAGTAVTSRNISAGRTAAPAPGTTVSSPRSGGFSAGAGAGRAGSVSVGA